MKTEQARRKVTAILSADVEGARSLMGEDEVSAVRTRTCYIVCDHKRETA